MTDHSGRVDRSTSDFVRLLNLSAEGNRIHLDLPSTSCRQNYWERYSDTLFSARMVLRSPRITAVRILTTSPWSLSIGRRWPTRPPNSGSSYLDTTLNCGIGSADAQGLCPCASNGTKRPQKSVEFGLLPSQTSGVIIVACKC